jgi:hypothetical protein
VGSPRFLPSFSQVQCFHQSIERDGGGLACVLSAPVLSLRGATVLPASPTSYGAKVCRAQGKQRLWPASPVVPNPQCFRVPLHNEHPTAEEHIMQLRWLAAHSGDRLLSRPTTSHCQGAPWTWSQLAQSIAIACLSPGPAPG